MTLFGLIEEDGIRLKKVASTHGGEWCGPCPLCGGRDRFRVWPEQNGGAGSWYCRGCNKGGDCIEYLKYFRGMSYLETCNYLGQEPEPLSQDRKPKQPEWTPRETMAPGETWLNKAGLLINWAEQQLWSEKGRAVLEYLKAERGLTEDTIRATHLGWNPKTLYRNRKNWGLPEELREDGKPKSVWIPAGLVIPAYVGNILHRIRIRRLEPGAEPPYVFLSGGKSSPMILGKNQKIFIIVESELCGILLHQEIGDMAGVIATGNAQSRPDDRTTELLRHAELILNALDSDNPGAKEAWQWWPDHFEQGRRMPPTRGKDPSEMRKYGVDLKEWASIWIEEYSPKQQIILQLDPEPQPDLQPQPQIQGPDSADQVESLGAIIFGPGWNQINQGWKSTADCLSCNCLIRWFRHPADGQTHKYCTYHILAFSIMEDVELDSIDMCPKVAMI